jgi:predicted DsbA family dithiol-disulfide isomerase
MAGRVTAATRFNREEQAFLWVQLRRHEAARSLSHRDPVAHRDIRAAGVVSDILAALGLDPGPAPERARAVPAKAARHSATEAAMAAGMFGAPSFVVGGELH